MHKLRSFGQKSGANSDSAAQPLPAAGNPAAKFLQPPGGAAPALPGEGPSRRESAPTGHGLISVQGYLRGRGGGKQGFTGSTGGRGSRAGRQAQQLSITADLTMRSQTRRSQREANARGRISPPFDGCSSTRLSSCSVRPTTVPPRNGGPPPFPPPPPCRIRTQRTAGRKRSATLPRTPPW